MQLSFLRPLYDRPGPWCSVYLDASAARQSPRRAAAVPPTTSQAVVHLHRLGSCRGRLNVSRDGVAFVPEKADEPDAFTLKFAEFVRAFSDDTLTLKTATKTYRFKAGGSGDEGTRRMRDLANRIARARS